MGRATSGGTAPTPRQVFVDDSGRRSRWAALAGAGVTVLCAAYIGVVALGLSQTEVGPLLAVPAGGNGQSPVSRTPTPCPDCWPPAGPR